MLTRAEIQKRLTKWNQAWDQHDLDGVMELFHEDVVFDNWTGGQARGKEALRKAGRRGLRTTADFGSPRRTPSSTSPVRRCSTAGPWTGLRASRGMRGNREAEGVDVLHFEDGKIIQKLTYSKTTLEIGGRRIKLSASRPG